MESFRIGGTGSRAASLLGVVAVVFGLAACGSSSSSSSTTSTSSSSSSGATETGPIKVGNISSVTGPVPLPEGIEGANAFFKTVNAKGGINGRKIELIAEDDKLDPVRAAQAARALVQQDKVVALVADFSLESCTLNHAFFEKENVSDIYAGGAELACFKSANISPVNVGPLGDWLITEKFVAETLKAKNVCALQTNIGAANATHKIANAYAARVFGKPFKYVDATLEANSNITAMIVKAKQENCEVLMTDGTPPQTITFVTAAKQQGLTAPLVFMGAQYSPELAKAITDTPPHTLYSIAEMEPFTEKTPIIEKMSADLAAAKVPLNGLSQFGWQAARTFYEVASKISGPINRESVNKALLALTSLDTEGMTGTPYAFGPGKAHNSNRSGKIVELANGTWKTVSKEWVTIAPGAEAEG